MQDTTLVDGRPYVDNPITVRQRQVLRFISAWCEAHGWPPSHREICEGMQIASTNGVLEHLKALVRKGCIEREIATARAIRITETGRREIEAEDEE